MTIDYTEWHQLKTRLHNGSHPPFFQEREVWWCSVGLNIGYEVFGKDDEYSRPVLILRKYNHYTFFGLPMTSRRKDIPAHYPLDFREKRGSVLLDQGRTFDARRLLRRMGRLYQHDVDDIVQAYLNHLKNLPPSKGIGAVPSGKL